jgi:predicted hydrocarbon binding protein
MVKMKKLETKRKAGRTSGRIGEAHLVVETIGVVSEEVGVVFMARMEEEVAISAVAEGVSVVAEEASGIVMGIISEVEGEEVSGVEVVMEEIGEEIGEDSGRVLVVKVVGEVSEVVKMLEDTRRGTHLVAAKTRKLSLMIEF